MLQPAANERPVSSYSSGSTMPYFLPGDPMNPAGGERVPRQWDYPVGVNAIPGPRPLELISFVELRNLARYYEGVQLCEGVVIQSLQRLRLHVVPRAEYVGDGNPAAPEWANLGRAMEEWFAAPDRTRHDLPSWMAAAERDLIEIDALGVYHRHDRAGRLYSLELVAGDTLAPLIDLEGRTPEYPAPAYAQVLHGVVASLWSRRHMDYLLEHPRTDSPYGLSRVERVVIAVNRALRKEHYDLARFTEGTIPAGYMVATDPKLFGLNADKFAILERQWNALLAGNTTERMRTRFIPPGWDFKSVATEDIQTEFDRWLLNITAAACGLTMDELGFTETSNRSVGDSQERVVRRNSTKPRAEYYGRYFDTIIRRYAGTPLWPNARSVSVAGRPITQAVWDARYHVVWDGLEDPDEFSQRVTDAAAMVKAGILDADGARAWLKLPREMVGVQ
jgi:hypothetical protein